MILHDAEYNKHFRYMVTSGFICGLIHPIEWLIDYSRCMAIPYDDMPAVDEFVKLAWNEFFKLEHQREPGNILEIQAWIDSYYAAGKKEQHG